MRLIIDMNLSPAWKNALASHGIESAHWSEIGRSNDPDEVIFDWCKRQNAILFTNDLDFGAILAATKSPKPSVIQFRTQDVSPGTLAARLASILKSIESQLSQGALVVVDERNHRIRMLSIG